jgi:glycosyltransferase involved in cell wall biosynthesis
MTTATDGRKVLYITFDGLTDPLGRSQVLPYLVGLAARGHEITILSCEKPARLEAGQAAVQEIVDRAGIAWRSIPYRNRPAVLAHAFTVARLVMEAGRLHRECGGFDLVHCRSYPPAMVGLRMKRKFGTRFLFDMRGFWPEEKVEGGSWPQSSPLYRFVYRALKEIEDKLFRGADHVISLTHLGKRIMLEWPQLRGADKRITVIPCCVDFEHFPIPTPEKRAEARAELGLAADAEVMAYLGSLGAWYMPGEMLDLFRTYARDRPKARFLLVTPDPPEQVEAAAAARQIDADRLVIRYATREQVPVYLAAADLGVFLIRPVPSKAASSPTKMGEMLALGLPTIANGGVGDVAEILDSTGAGVAIETFDEATYDSAIATVEAIAIDRPEIRQRALPWFDVELGIERYDRIYRSL